MIFSNFYFILFFFFFLILNNFKLNNLNFLYIKYFLFKTPYYEKVYKVRILIAKSLLNLINRENT